MNDRIIRLMGRPEMKEAAAGRQGAPLVNSVNLRADPRQDGFVLYSPPIEVGILSAYKINKEASACERTKSHTQ